MDGYHLLNEHLLLHTIILFKNDIVLIMHSSKGGAKILRLGQYVSRIIEQCIYTNYKPYLNIRKG